MGGPNPWPSLVPNLAERRRPAERCLTDSGLELTKSERSPRYERKPVQRRVGHSELWLRSEASGRTQQTDQDRLDTSATRHFGIKTLWDTSAPISRHFNTKNVVRDTSTRVPWSRKSPDTSTQDNSADETQLHRWFVLNFGTDFVVTKCLGAEVSCGQSVRLPPAMVQQ